MKRIALLGTVLSMLCTGCQFEAPLDVKSSGPIDDALLGRWQLESDDGDEDETLLVLPFSKHEYLVEYAVGQGQFFYRAYPIKVGTHACVQLQVIGTQDGPVEKEDEDFKPFQVAVYRIVDGRLQVRLLDPDVVDGAATSTVSLRQSFLKHQDSPDLFDEPGWFSRVKP